MPTCPICHKQTPRNTHGRHVAMCSRRPTPARLREMREGDGLTLKQIAAELGMPGAYNTVRRWMIEAGIDTQRRGYKGNTTRRSDAEAYRGQALDVSGGCDACDAAQRSECQRAVRECWPVACEGVLVAGGVVELPAWVERGWIDEEIACQIKIG